MRISDWSSDVCSSDLAGRGGAGAARLRLVSFSGHNCAFVSIASPRRDPPMFSLQTIFGSGKQFFELLDESADAAYEAAKALHAMLKEADRQPALDAFKLARVRERSASDKISQALVESFMVPIEREDIERSEEHTSELQSLMR